MVSLFTELNQIRLKIQDAKHQKELQTILNNPLKRNANIIKNKELNTSININNQNNNCNNDSNKQISIPINQIHTINSNSEVIDLDCVDDDNQLNNLIITTDKDQD